jgi:gas vesicle protein
MYENNKKDFMWGVLAGGTLATLVSLLFTTKKGKQIQKQVGDLYDDIETNVKDAFTNSKENNRRQRQKKELRKLLLKSKIIKHHSE